MLYVRGQGSKEVVAYLNNIRWRIEALENVRLHLSVLRYCQREYAELTQVFGLRRDEDLPEDCEMAGESSMIKIVWHVRFGSGYGLQLG